MGVFAPSVAASGRPAGGRFLPVVLAGRRGRPFVQDKHSVALQVFIKLVDGNVVNLAQPAEEIRVVKRLGHLARAAFAGPVGIGKSHAQAGIYEDHRAASFALRLARSASAAANRGPAGRGTPTAACGQQPAPRASQLGRVAPVHLPHHGEDGQEHGDGDDPIGVRLDARPFERGARRQRRKQEERGDVHGPPPLG